MPEAPITQTWDCSAAALITPRLPVKLRRIPGLLDRFGAVRLTPSTIGIDNVRAVPWTAVTEIRTCPPSQIAATVTEDLVAGQLARLIPIPGSGFVARAMTSRIVDHVTSLVFGLLQTSLREHREDAQVPCWIRYQAHRTTVDLSPGPVSSALLCLPRVAASVIVTAQQHGTLIAAPRSG